MSTEITGEMDLSERVGALEKESRRLKVVGMLLLLATVLFSRYLPGRKAIEAQYLSLRDEDGKQRVFITANRFAAGVNLLDSNERLQVGLSTEGNHPKLTIFDANEKKRIAIGMMDEGPTFLFADAAEKSAFMLIERDGRSGLAILDPEGNIVWSAPQSVEPPRDEPGKGGRTR